MHVDENFEDKQYFAFIDAMFTKTEDVRIFAVNYP